MAKKKIEDLLAEYEVAAKKAVQDLAEVPLASRAGHGMLIENAKAALPILREEIIAATVPARLIGVFATGDSGKLAEIFDFLRANGGIVLDISSIAWGEIADRIEPSFPDDRNFRVVQHNLMIQAYGQIAKEVGFNQVSTPGYVEAICRNRAETINHIRSRVRSVVGDEFMIRIVKERIVDAVASNNLEDRRVPVLVTASAAEERPALTGLFLRTNSFFCQSDFEVTKESVTGIFKNPTASQTASTNP